MHKIAYFATVTVSALCFFACSQTVEAPSQDDDDEALYSSSSSKKKNQDNSSKDNQTKKSSSSKSSDWDDDFDDNGGFVIDTAKITRSGFEFTGEKRDCDFSVDDSVWTIEDIDSISTSMSYITFSKTAMEIKMEFEGQYSDADSCEQAV
ncbi:MAG: hypothetical protein J5521_00225, partial [Lachnospiraceae bacterium]|nr:hypothetical protein [Lachnospiraceae bacterium]